MKRTVIMLAVIATFFITWVLIAFFCSTISENTVKQLMSDTGVVMLMMAIGWIPSVIVAIDLDERLEQ